MDSADLGFKAHGSRQPKHWQTVPSATMGIILVSILALFSTPYKNRHPFRNEGWEKEKNQRNSRLESCFRTQSFFSKKNSPFSSMQVSSRTFWQTENPSPVSMRQNPCGLSQNWSHQSIKTIRPTFKKRKLNKIPTREASVSMLCLKRKFIFLFWFDEPGK